MSATGGERRIVQSTSAVQTIRTSIRCENEDFSLFPVPVHIMSLPLLVLWMVVGLVHCSTTTLKPENQVISSPTSKPYKDYIFFKRQIVILLLNRKLVRQSDHVCNSNAFPCIPGGLAAVSPAINPAIAPAMINPGIVPPMVGPAIPGGIVPPVGNPGYYGGAGGGYYGGSYGAQQPFRTGTIGRLRQRKQPRQLLNKGFLNRKM